MLCTQGMLAIIIYDSGMFVFLFETRKSSGGGNSPYLLSSQILPSPGFHHRHKHGQDGELGKVGPAYVLSWFIASSWRPYSSSNIFSTHPPLTINRTFWLYKEIEKFFFFFCHFSFANFWPWVIYLIYGWLWFLTNLGAYLGDLVQWENSNLQTVVRCNEIFNDY